MKIITLFVFTKTDLLKKTRTGLVLAHKGQGSTREVTYRTHKLNPIYRTVGNPSCMVYDGTCRDCSVHSCGEGGVGMRRMQREIRCGDEW